MLGLMAAVLLRLAVLPAGLPVRVQRNVSAPPSGSADAAPLRNTLLLRETVWSGPAFATGGRLTVEHAGRVQRCEQVRASARVMRLSRFGSRGSVAPLAAWSRAAVIRPTSAESMSWSPSASQTSGRPCAIATWDAASRRHAAMKPARRLNSVVSPCDLADRQPPASSVLAPRCELRGQSPAAVSGASLLLFTYLLCGLTPNDAPGAGAAPSTRAPAVRYRSRRRSRVSGADCRIR